MRRLRPRHRSESASKRRGSLSHSGGVKMSTKARMLRDFISYSGRECRRHDTVAPAMGKNFAPKCKISGPVGVFITRGSRKSACVGGFYAATRNPTAAALQLLLPQPRLLAHGSGLPGPSLWVRPSLSRPSGTVAPDPHRVRRAVTHGGEPPVRRPSRTESVTFCRVETACTAITPFRARGRRPRARNQPAASPGGASQGLRSRRVFSC